MNTKQKVKLICKTNREKVFLLLLDDLTNKQLAKEECINYNFCENITNMFNNLLIKTNLTKQNISETNFIDETNKNITTKRIFKSFLLGVGIL